MDAIEVTQVSKAFGTVQAVDDVSFGVAEGEIFGLLGPNGAGKTTIIRLILDLFKPDQGKVSILGGPMTEAKKNRIGYMPEERGLYQDDGLERILVYLASLKGVPASEAHRRPGFPAVRRTREGPPAGPAARSRVRASHDPGALARSGLGLELVHELPDAGQAHGQSAPVPLGEDLFQVADFESRLRFPTCKLIDRLETDWRDDHSLPVQLARAQIEALRTTGDPERRYRAKWRLVRKLYELGYNAEELREIFRLIDWSGLLLRSTLLRFSSFSRFSTRVMRLYCSHSIMSPDSLSRFSIFAMRLLCR